ncbi:NatC auxiliary subunit of N-alpha-acetyltransferase [Chloropicon primus]|uniref:NatC auxiliary subunit of N-alpha-acetyltransferase n=1 Tax=Chloropicon primus TaxID=1764295 RepID=A0A5B8MI22_9CHLO|nr:NatC auxiliary subunit of N-alpha-acetyltransferase [Chloropicon primus]|mmetsp:Transcript_12080/g.33462  ORF Transcript_12080/g.33462 Transcript_12080/m.33462 type:complete len:708 (-) Transcript_12080:73-2196(-)|eukprot:QDZ20087.1 NatC auxiliary subunit of N-alpha-acetyltransferase [Chloropicon primus]
MEEGDDEDMFAGFERDCLPGRTVVEVTNVLERVCEALEDGEMIHTETFSLMEAVSAIELGDPKVDVGTIPEARNSGTPAELFKAGMAPLQLDFRSLLSLLDGILAREVCWYNGSFIAETLYTCLYLHDMDRLSSNSILKAYCELTRLTCLKIVSVVHRAGITEEEDFCLAYQGLPLHSGGDGDDPQKWMNFAQVVVTKLNKIASRVEGITSLNCEEFPITGQLSREDIESIAARIQLRHNYLLVINCLDAENVEAERQLLEKAIREARANLDVLERTSQEVNGCPSPPGFVRYLNKEHMPAIPPRTIEDISTTQVLAYYRNFLDHAEVVAQTTSCKNILSLETHLEGLSDRNPETVIRSLQARRCGKLALKEVVASSIGLSVKYLESEPDLAVCLIRCMDVAEAYMKAACHNKCQQNRKFRKVLRTLNDAANQLVAFVVSLQNLSQKEASEGSKNAERGQNELAISIVINWLASLSHSIALRQLLVGFDLDIYQKTEFLMMYWYCERLLAQYISTVQKWNSQLESMGEMVKMSKAKKKHKKMVVVNEDQVMSRIFVLESTRLAFNGIVRMLAALEKHGFISKAELPFNTEEHLYVQRFSHLYLAKRPDEECFPEPLCYDAYKYATNVQDMSLEQLCESAKLGFGNALRLLAHLRSTYGQKLPLNEGVDTLQRVCKSNQIAIALASKNMKLKCDLSLEKRIVVLKLRT